MTSTSGFLSWSASWAGGRSLPQSPATRIAWRIAQIQLMKDSRMNDVIAHSSSSTSRMTPEAVLRSGSGLPMSAISPALSATAIQLAPIVSPWIK